MAYGETTFTHQRNTVTGDGSGGKVKTPATLGEVTGRLNFYDRRSQMQMENEPGKQVQNLKFIVFDEPFPSIVREDLLIDGADTWEVKHVRSYDYSFQVDVELIT
jgi:hypothetical protein